MAVKILHTADWQIGKVFADIDDLDGDRAAELRSQRLKTVAKIAAKATEHAVDAVVVAGDVFDTNDRSKVTDELLLRTLGAMEGFGGDWLLLPGNHDAAGGQSAWERLKQLKPPANIKLMTTAEPQLIADHRLAILPAPLLRRHEASDVTAVLDGMQTPPETVRVGVAHGSVKSQLPEGSKVHNEIAADRADRARLDYLALGDWHGTKCIDSRTWYSGTPEQERFKDNDPGNVLLVDIASPGAEPEVSVHRVGVHRWIRLERTLSVSSDLDRLLQELGGLDENAVIDLDVSGQLDLADQQRLQHAVDQLAARHRSFTFNDDDLHLEPSDEDIVGLGADGYVGEVIATLREQQKEDWDEAAIARDALAILTTLLREHGREASR